MLKVFIDGSVGTTGLRIYERLTARGDIELLRLPEERRKDAAARREVLNSCDVAFLCLPDAAAIEAVSLIENPAVRVIDASTAHRITPGWTYGLPELSSARFQALTSSMRTAVPGCHASGFITLVAPLVQAGLISPDVRLTAHSITGYSGGGKSMIAAYNDEQRSELLDAPRQYGLTQQHKHLPEMQHICSLAHAPIFCPIVADFYSGMCVTVPLFKEYLIPDCTVQEVKEVYRQLYTGPIINYNDGVDADGLCSAAAFSGRDSMEICVTGNDDRILLISRFDNLGKGASGAALECLNIMTGQDPSYGLNL